MKARKIHAIDLFCGVGGLSFGLKGSGIDIVAGYDIDNSCRSTFEVNIGAPFVTGDIREVTGAELLKRYPKTGLRLLAGCAPCQPFSRHMRGADTSADAKWSLLDEFSRLVTEVRPHLVTMENVPGLSRTGVFRRFTSTLAILGYSVRYRSCYGPHFGLAQHRRRLVLVASALGELEPLQNQQWDRFPTVRDVIGNLPPIGAGQQSPTDPLHKARMLTDINVRRIQASKPGGTWHDWPEELLAECHKRETGSTFQSVYGRMTWDEPAPTITTQAYNFGTGRFGHPEQDRALTLREAALLQGFPLTYKFGESAKRVEFLSIGKHIGNAVPPPLGWAVGDHFIKHISQ
ncbi:modification methylase [Lysobacter concretionis Ko07 = DSM 16239]|uniref:DNA (cytosine-5-)-methyltransferase n=1 Tax=Lysobacter concretionis Ko07 = DSM 16239 TaxID=1122185 RepID=A0A0A0ELK8_9GAMM|nr:MULTISPECIES: DNA cytosine methyltransferase [Lysobacter]KGM51851.1 modification methylase [Lysobacter concretionis Ko07 = DSM 16239]QOD92073.1 DNA (cytosine-5-)-methyltransferase [Lysobacter sp. CW239]